MVPARVSKGVNATPVADMAMMVAPRAAAGNRAGTLGFAGCYR
jgi:uncharacterized membrane protein